MNIIIILITFILVYIIQEYVVNKKEKYDNKYLKLYEKVKYPLFITSFIVLIYNLNCKIKTEKDIKVNLDQPFFD